MATSPDRLPEPAPDERALSNRLADMIHAEIRNAGGTIDFSRFMELALYADGIEARAAGQGWPDCGFANGIEARAAGQGWPDCGFADGIEARAAGQGWPASGFAPGLGYYSGGRQKFGAAGDFVTAPELGSVFARCLARQCHEILDRLGDGDILEAGAGSGQLATDLLAELERLDCLPGRYLILELSAELRARQRQTIEQLVPHLAGRVQWLDRLPERFRGIVLGNELLDALPVDRFRVTNHGIDQLQVGWENGHFVWQARPADENIRTRIIPLGLPAGYESEIGLAAEGWVRTVAETIEAGALLLIDYGFPRVEFYHPQRATGTLMCHYRHRAHSDPLVLVGLQDITAHVDFTAVSAAGTAAGLDLLGYTSQALFLLGCGLNEIASASDPDDVRAHLALTSEIKKLTLPSEMGELFKVVAFGRGLGQALRGFAMQNRRRAVSGSG